MLDTRYGAAQSPIRVVGGGERVDKHPNVGSVRERTHQIQEMDGESNIFPRVFK